MLWRKKETLRPGRTAGRPPYRGSRERKARVCGELQGAQGACGAGRRRPGNTRRAANCSCCERPQLTNMRVRRRMGAVGWASRGSPHGADVHARSIRGMSGTGGAEAVEKSLGLRPPRVIFRCVRFSATGKGPLRGGSAPGNLSGEERSNDMNGLLKSLPAWLVGVYLAYGRNVEPAGLERATVGGGRAGRRHRIDGFVGGEPVEGEEGLVAHVVPGVARTKRSEPASIFQDSPVTRIRDAGRSILVCLAPASC